MIYAVLIIINKNEVRLSFTEASSFEQAYYNAQYEYRTIDTSNNSLDIQIFEAKVRIGDFEEVKIEYLG